MTNAIASIVRPEHCLCLLVLPLLTIRTSWPWCRFLVPTYWTQSPCGRALRTLTTESPTNRLPDQIFALRRHSGLQAFLGHHHSRTHVEGAYGRHIFKADYSDCHVQGTEASDAISTFETLCRKYSYGLVEIKFAESYHDTYVDHGGAPFCKQVSSGDFESSINRDKYMNHDKGLMVLITPPWSFKLDETF